MEISEVRIKLMEGSEDRLRAFCSITIDDCFVIRDLKIIDGTSGSFVAMPSRKLTGHCSKCHHKNHLRANYCNHCGTKASAGNDGHFDSPQKLYADVAHPINSECREMIQSRVLKEFDSELRRSEQPGYRSRYDDSFDDGEDFDADDVAAPPNATRVDATDETELDSSVKVDPGSGSVKKARFMEKRRVTQDANEPDAESEDFGEGIF